MRCLGLGRGWQQQDMSTPLQAWEEQGSLPPLCGWRGQRAVPLSQEEWQCHHEELAAAAAEYKEPAQEPEPEQEAQAQVQVREQEQVGAAVITAAPFRDPIRKSAPTKAAVTNGPNLCHRPQEQAADQVVEALLLQVVGDLGALVACKRKANGSAPVRERSVHRSSVFLSPELGPRRFPREPAESARSAQI